MDAAGHVIDQTIDLVRRKLRVTLRQLVEGLLQDDFNIALKQVLSPSRMICVMPVQDLGCQRPSCVDPVDTGGNVNVALVYWSSPGRVDSKLGI